MLKCAQVRVAQLVNATATAINYPFDTETGKCRSEVICILKLPNMSHQLQQDSIYPLPLSFIICDTSQVVDALDLLVIEELQQQAVLVAVAVWFGSVRLIDNVVIEPGHVSKLGTEA